MELRDYANSDFDIQYAMVDQAKMFPDIKKRPNFILWNGKKIKTSDVILVPRSGIITAQVLSSKTGIHQGFDIKLNGWLRLEGGEQVKILRTWKDEHHEDMVSYHFLSDDNALWFWNVYKRLWPDGRITEEKWTGNAGFFVDIVSEVERIYYCSHGMAHEPDFESFVVKLNVLPK